MKKLLLALFVVLLLAFAVVFEIYGAPVAISIIFLTVYILGEL
jgi:hypothetical protein